MNGWITNEWVSEWMNESKNEWSNECMKHCEMGLLLQSRAHFALWTWPHKSKAAPNAWDFQLIFMWARSLATVSCAFCRADSTTQIQSCSVYYVKSSSRWSLVHILPTPSSKNVPNRLIFDDFLMKLSSCYSLVRILSTSSSQRAPNLTWHFFCIFKCESNQIELSQRSCALFVDDFCRSRPATAETETLLWRLRKPLYGKKRRVSRPRVFQAWTHVFPNCYTSQLLDDDVVDMMMWLT
jgi:hypothetical protein